MKEFRVRTAALLALLLTIVANAASGQERLSGSVELEHQIILAGEHQDLNIVISNNTRRALRVVTLKEGLASGAIEFRLIDTEGKLVPPAFDIDRTPRVPEAVTRLSPGDKIAWSGINTEGIGLDTHHPGKYKLRIRVPVDREVLTIWKELFIVAAEEMDIQNSVTVPLAAAPWADEGEEGRVEWISVGRQAWLFYRRVNKFGVQAVVRLARLAQDSRFSVDGKIDRFEIRYVDTEGEDKFLCIDPQDGTRLEFLND